MSHVRTQIRDQMIVELDVLEPTVFKSVQATRLYAYREDQLPALNIYQQGEESEPLTMGGALDGSMQKRLMRRGLLMATECYVATTTDLDDIMDEMAAPIEAILGNTLLNDLIQDISLTTTSFEIDSGGETPVGVLTMIWLIVYRTYEGAPEVSV